MDGFSDYLIKQLLDRHFGGETAVVAPSTLHFALFTTAPLKDGTGGAEVLTDLQALNGYARKAVAATGSNFPNTVSGTNLKTNANAISFASPSDSWGNVVALGIYDSAIGDDKAFTVDTGADTIEAVAHGYTDYVPASGAGSVVMFYTSGTLPAPLVANTPYYVRDDTADDFKISTTPGGGAIDITTAGTGTFYVRSVGNLLAACAIPHTNMPIGRIFAVPAGALRLTLPAGVFSDYLSRRILDFFFSGQAFTIPSIYLALFTTAPDSAGSGGAEVSVSVGDYAREPVTNNDTNFPDSVLGSGLKYLDGLTTFDTPSDDWGDIVAVGAYDAAAGGNLLWVKTVSTTTVLDLAPPTIGDENFRIELS